MVDNDTVGSVIEQICGPGASPRLSDDEARTGAALLKALADPARLQILDILSRCSGAGEICACEFEGYVGMRDPKSGQRPKQPTISHHLRVLRNAGLIDGEKHGLWIYYRIRTERLEEIQALLRSIMGPAKNHTSNEARNGSSCC